MSVVSFHMPLNVGGKTEFRRKGEDCRHEALLLHSSHRPIPHAATPDIALEWHLGSVSRSRMLDRGPTPGAASLASSEVMGLSDGGSAAPAIQASATPDDGSGSTDLPVP